MISASRLLRILAAFIVLAMPLQARAATDIALWHAMSGELGRQLEKLAADFNASQSDYRIVPAYKGNYTETVTAAIFAFRSRSQPAIVQVNEVATATMTAAKGAIYPVFTMMRDMNEPFSLGDYLPAVSGYYTDAAGNLLSFPFNSSTPILYYNKTMFRDAGLDPETPPKTWPELGLAAKRLRELGAVCGFTTSWPSWIHVENFSAFHNLPLATRTNGFAGLDAELTINNPVVVQHIAQLAEWQKDKVFDYGGRGQSAEPRFQKGECGIFIGSSATRADIKANSKFDIGYGMMPYWPDVKNAPQNSIIGGATLWGAARPPAPGIQGCGAVLRLSVAARRAGGLAPEHRLSADHPRRLRADARAGFLRAQSGLSDLVRRDHAASADGELEGHPARLLRADPRRDRGRAGAGLYRPEGRAGCARCRGRARQQAAASVRARQPGSVETGWKPGIGWNARSLHAVMAGHSRPKDGVA
ncbi:ABC-type glycerol-3-phosphate transport system substrate-binding protein [Bradyrhizobium barranii subsp. barranii]